MYPSTTQPDVRDGLTDSQYDNPLLVQIASESPTFNRLLQHALSEFRLDAARNARVVTVRETQWLGSFIDAMQEHTQVQLLVTQLGEDKVDED